MSSSELTPLLFLGAMLVLFFLLVIRPNRRQQQTVAEFQRTLEVGERVVLSSGIFGTVRTVSDTRVTLEIAPGTVIEIAKQVVVRKVEDLPDASAQGDRDAQDDQGLQANPEADSDTDPATESGPRAG